MRKNDTGDRRIEAGGDCTRDTASNKDIRL